MRHSLLEFFFFIILSSAFRLAFQQFPLVCFRRVHGLVINEDACALLSHANAGKNIGLQVKRIQILVYLMFEERSHIQQETRMFGMRSSSGIVTITNTTYYFFSF